MIDGRVGLNTVCLSGSLGKFLNQQLTDGNTACHSHNWRTVTSLRMNRMSEENRNAKDTLKENCPSKQMFMLP